MFKSLLNIKYFVIIYNMSTKIYNGIGDLPKGKRYGTPQEALEMKQVRRYGKLKIDPRIVAKIEKKEVVPETREKLLLRLAALKGLIRRNKGRYETTKQGEAAKAQYYEDWQKALTEAKKIISKLEKIEKKREVEKVEKINKKVVAKPKEKVGHSNWISHVKKVMEDKGISYREALSVASKTYKK